MPARSDSLKDRLSRSDEITISVVGRKSGRTISNPVWFVMEGDKFRGKYGARDVKKYYSKLDVAVSTPIH